MKTYTQVPFALALTVALTAGLAAQTQKPAPQSPVGTSGATPSTSAPRSGGSARVSTDYKLVSGDKLKIEVFKDPQLSQELQIRPDGKITLPLLGDVPAAGQTALELRDQLTASLKEYITNPVVTVIVRETMPQVVHVMGEVYSPGAHPIYGEMTVLQALAAAGGFKDFAKKSKISIQRRTANGRVQVIKYDYKAAVEGRGQPVFVQPGDTIIVP
jgi:polysaccharide export outer membrane protein